MPFWTFAYNNIEPTNKTRESFQKGIAGLTFALNTLEFYQSQIIAIILGTYQDFQQCSISFAFF